MKRLGLMLALACMTASAHAATCSSTGGAFASWKKEFAAEAKANGVGSRAISGLR